VLLEIHPEPSEQERAAIVAVLARLLAAEQEEPCARADWWRAGVRESVEDEEREDF
jgi:hypothetical protein